MTHKSIGETNEQWEENRKLFVEKYKSHLPIKLPIDPNKKLKVLISCLFFRTFTGSELYVYELAKNLIKQNCDVTVVSQIGGPLTELAKKQGIKCLSFEQSPGFKLGDGKWGITTENGFQVSQENVMYRISDVNFDVIHMQIVRLKLLIIRPSISDRIINFGFCPNHRNSVFEVKVSFDLRKSAFDHPAAECVC
jgi:hypothetical protein